MRRSFEIVFRAAPQAALGVFLVAGIESAASATYALWLGWFTDAATRGLIGLALASAIGLTLAAGARSVLAFVLDRWQTQLGERTNVWALERRLTVAGGINGIEHFETPDVLHRIDWFRNQSWRLAWLPGVAAGLVAFAVRLVLTAVLLARVHPLLVLTF